MKNHIAQVVIGVVIATIIGFGSLAKFTADAWADEKLELYLTIAAWQADKADIVGVMKAREKRDINRRIRQLERVGKQRSLTEDEEALLDDYKEDYRAINGN